jgi:methylenetetrahydrofolate dehydrogenase (NADP+)/methenyltetrahydrofolate cyclohydrolase
MIVNGTEIGRDILATTKRDSALVRRSLIVEAIVVAPTPATESYLRIKAVRAADAGMELSITRLPDEATTEEVATAVRASTAAALIVQLPLPPGIDTSAVLNAIPRAQDADVLSDGAYQDFVDSVPEALLPPVVGAVAEIFRRAGVALAGKRVVVIGNGKLVGRPMVAWFKQQGIAPAVVDQGSAASLAMLIKNADVIVSGVGQAGLITADMLKPGVVLIDAGTSESGGAIVGDATPSCSAIASVFTPVPGGVGPIAVACLFRNALTLGLQAGRKTV